MVKQIVSIAFLVLFCISASGYADNSGNEVLKGVKLSGSRQGQSVGFVDVDGDGIADKIVGAPYAALFSSTGAVLMYKGDAQGGFSCSPSMLLAGDDNYGFSFVNLGDVDADGNEDFAVGAINGNGSDVSLSGNVTVYKGGRNRSRYGACGKVIAKLSGEGPMDKFGVSLSAGDLNGDGVKDLIVGAPFNTIDAALYQGGAVYVYFAPDFTNKVALRASSLTKGLGWSAVTGDINGDHISDLCISASGKVLCYYSTQDFNPLIDAPDVMITSASSGFGKSIAVIGDLTGDDFGEIVIGAPNAVINGNRDTGSIYIVKGGAGKRTVNVDTPSPDLIVRIDGAALFDRFGFSLAAVGNIDGDQRTDFAVGAPMSDANAFALAGKVYLFKGADISGSATLSNSTVFEGFTGDQGYGTSLGASKNGWLLIGAPRTNSDTGYVSMVDPSTGQIVPGGSSGGPSGSGDECH